MVVKTAVVELKSACPDVYYLQYCTCAISVICDNIYDDGGE